LKVFLRYFREKNVVALDFLLKGINLQIEANDL